MKIFAFDPKTGKRGEFIENSRVNKWTSSSIDWAVENCVIEPVECVVPKSSPTVNWTSHTDAGGYDNLADMNDVSYKRDQWICFCTGEWFCGEDHGVWEWVILPPKDLLVYIEKEV